MVNYVFNLATSEDSLRPERMLSLKGTFRSFARNLLGRSGPHKQMIIWLPLGYHLTES